MRRVYRLSHRSFIQDIVVDDAKDLVPYLEDLSAGDVSLCIEEMWEEGDDR